MIPDILTLARRPWRTTLYFWYGDEGFARTLLEDMGWSVDGAAPIEGDVAVAALFDSVSDTLEHTATTDRLLLRSVNRWNMLAWRNDCGGSLGALTFGPPMPLVELTIGGGDGAFTLAVRLGPITQAFASDGSGVEGDGPARVLTFHVASSTGLPARKVVKLYDQARACIESLGAPPELLDLSEAAPGRRALLSISERFD